MAQQGQAQQQAAQVAPPFAFALAPSLINDDPIDYSTPEGIKLYKSNTEPLSSKFDLSTDNLKTFLEEVRQRARMANWWSLLTMTQGGNTYNLIDHYGTLTKATVRNNSISYIGSTAGANGRKAQNAVQLFQFLVDSLTEDAKKKLFTRPSEYQITSALAPAGTPPMVDGPLFLKHIVSESHIDTNATINTIRTRLLNLPRAMEEFNSDIEKFNHYVEQQVIALAARGETTQDLLVNLFQAYRVAKDKEFRDYIKSKERAFNEGTSISPEVLMQLALNEYKRASEANSWGLPSDEEQKIVTLTSLVENLKKQNDQLKRAPNPGRGGRGHPRGSRGFGRGNYDQRGRGRGRGTPARGRGRGRSGNRNHKQDYHWAKPKEGDPTEKDINGKHYYWCPNHDKWVMHKPENCYMKAEHPSQSQDQGNDKQPVLQVNKALAAILEGRDYGQE
jgi:hypothetical protein